MRESEKRIYIIGAGAAGKMIAAELSQKRVFGKVCAFLDDNSALAGAEIDGIPVFCPVSRIELLYRDSNDEAIIAMPTAPKERVSEIYRRLLAAGFSKIRILPGISQIVEGDAHLVQTREINPLDILGRDEISVSLKESLFYLKKKRVLVTGAGGSVGSELSRQLLSAGVERLYLLGHGENSIYNIDRELRLLQREGVGEKTDIVPIIADVSDAAHIQNLLPKMRLEAVFHCAAHKHVPLMEENPVAAIENNVFGTKNMLDAALNAEVPRFVLISTDKAVKPASVYGKSKMLCEKLVLRTAERTKQNQTFIFVRFGNVLDSRGSVLPLFAEQIKAGGPITVTHPEMRRYFITIPEAASLVLKAGGIGENGAAYLLDMGESIKVVDLAEHLIRFYGLESGADVKIEFSGIRAGERLDEPLWLPEENPQKTECKMIFRLDAQKLAEIDEILENLRPICFFDKEFPQKYRDSAMLRKILDDLR